MEEKLDFLIKFLIKDTGRTNEEIPNTLEEKEKLWRALCNIREPKPVSDEYLKVQDEFLQERLKNQNVIDVRRIKTLDKLFPDKEINNGERLGIWQGNIINIKADCIVNAANSKGLGCFQPLHNCIDNQIQTYSGVQMRLECNEYMNSAKYEYGLPTGEVFITKGYNLPAKYVIHTVGPVVNFSVTDEEKKLLKNCYINSLKIATQKGLKTIAIPCISTGIFGFPRKLAAEYAIEAVNEFLDNNDEIERVIFNVFGDENFEIYYEYFQNLD